MTEQQNATAYKIMWPALAVIFAAGSAIMTLSYSEDRIEKLEAWQAAHASGQHSETVRDLALLRMQDDQNSRQRDEQAAGLKELGRQVVKMNRTLDALCAASPRCQPGD